MGWPLAPGHVPPHYANGIEELVGEPRLSAEEQIDRARDALHTTAEDELAELVGALVEHPAASSDGGRSEAYRMFYRPPDMGMDPAEKRVKSWQRMHEHQRPGGRSGRFGGIDIEPDG